jgi:hypothetical protein
MSQSEQQGKGVEALKALNNTIVTSRIYPPDAPQVAQVLERGYHGLMDYFAQYGPLALSLADGVPRINLQPLGDEVLASFPNLVVYRQLRHLALPRLVLGAEMDRLAFAQLVSVFNAPVEKIKREGGGLALVTSLGLATFFPVSETVEAGASNEEDSDGERLEQTVRVRPELVASLLEQDLRPAVVAELGAKMAAVATAVPILAATVGEILQGIREQKTILAVPAFPLLLVKAEGLLPPGEGRRQVLATLAELLVAELKEPALADLLAQRFPEGFGIELYAGLVAAMPMHKFAGVVSHYREKITRSGLQGAGHPADDLLVTTLQKLLATEKGKQYLGAEKAKALIDAGERERKTRRLEAGLKALLQGQTGVLASEELVLLLPKAVSRLESSGKNSEVKAVLSQLGAAIQAGNVASGSSLLLSLVGIGEVFVAAGRPDRLASLLPLLREMVLRAEVVDPALEKALVFLYRVMYQSWEGTAPALGDEILLFIHRLRSGEIVRPKPVRNLVGKVQDREIQRKGLPQLLKQCLAEPQAKALRRRLVLQGPVAVRFLVDSLIKAEQAEKRLLLIDLLTGQRDFLPRVIHERLPEHMPWYGKRNLIKLLGECGGEEDAEKVLPFLRHEDVRVQREAFLCLYKIGGRQRKGLLLAGLANSAEPVKLQIIAALTPLCDQEVATALSGLLQEHEEFSPDTARSFSSNSSRP